MSEPPTLISLCSMAHGGHGNILLDHSMWRELLLLYLRVPQLHLEYVLDWEELYRNYCWELWPEWNLERRGEGIWMVSWLKKNPQAVGTGLHLEAKAEGGLGGSFDLWGTLLDNEVPVAQGVSGKFFLSCSRQFCVFSVCLVLSPSLSPCHILIMDKTCSGQAQIM